MLFYLRSIIDKIYVFQNDKQFWSRKSKVKTARMEVDNSESPSTSGTSTPAIQEGGQQSASGKRFEYLLKQTELFSHFMGGNKATSPLKVSQ